MTTGNVIKGMVLYADGGARPNPGFGGYGVHGYIYSAVSPSKGTGRNFVTTSQGYVDRNQSNDVITVKNDESAEEHLNNRDPVHVTPVAYVDMTGSINGLTTNNTSEIVAMTKALQYASKREDIKYLQIFTDSEYTKKGVNNWIDTWSDNNWYKSDGNMVANNELWRLLKDARDAVLNKNIDLCVEWIKGHDGATGNEKADMLASMGVFDAQRGVVNDNIQETAAEDYWKTTVTRHPFIAQRRCYFSSQSEVEPGVYYLGDHGKDDELLGKRVSDGSYSVIKLSEPDNILDLIRNHQTSMSDSSDSIFAMNVDQIYRADLYKTLAIFGEKSLEPPSGYRRDIWHASKVPITREFKPPRLAARSIEELIGLEVILEKFKNNSPDLIVSDITEYFYDVTEKKIPAKKGQSQGTVELVTKLKNEIVVGQAEVLVKCKLPFLSNSSFEELKLTLGIDVLDRNSLKKLELFNPQVYVVTWEVSDNAYRYATIIRANESVGIWCGVYSNLRIIGVKKS